MTTENRDTTLATLNREPLVSVVVPAWNAEATLARALRSALAQDYPNLEVIVVDDGSTDGTRAAAEAFAARAATGECGARAAEGLAARAGAERSGPVVRCLARPHAGAAAARNAGVAEARGEFVAFLDADDEWLPGYVRRVTEPMLRDPAVGMTWCRSLRRTPDGREAIFGRAFGRAKPFRDRLWPPAEQCTPATICRAEVLRRAGETGASKVAQAFQPACAKQAGKPAPLVGPSPGDESAAGPFDESLATREDQDLWIRMSELAGVVEVSDALVVVHARDRGSESGRDWPRIRADYFAILERALVRRPDLYAPHRREIRAEAAWHWGLMALKAGDCASARRALWRSFLTAPRLRTLPPALASLLPSAMVGRLLRLRRSGEHSTSGSR